MLPEFHQLPAPALNCRIGYLVQLPPYQLPESPGRPLDALLLLALTILLAA